MGFVSFFKIIQGASIDPHFQICSQISPFLNIYKFDHGHLRIFHALLYTDTLLVLEINRFLNFSVYLIGQFQLVVIRNKVVKLLYLGVF